MAMRFTILGSGSAGNAALLVTADHGQVHVGDRLVVPSSELLSSVTLQSGEGRFRLLHATKGAVEDVAAAARDGAGWLLASANLDPYPAQLQGQFAALAQLRAIETGRWLVSAANTGPSLLVDSSGAVRQRLSTGRAGTLSMQLQVRAGLTGYSRAGELPLLLLAVAAGIARQRSRVRQS